MIDRIGIFGGSFDPPHKAHVALARRLAGVIGLTELCLVPAGQPWQKHQLQSSSTDRVKMLELAFKDVPFDWQIDTRELERVGPSYSADTLREMRHERGASACLVFLMGADQMLGLPSWHDWPRLLNLANFAVAGRPGSALEQSNWSAELKLHLAPRIVTASALDLPAGQVALVPADFGDISSSRVRQLIALPEQQLAADLLPSSVLDYIRQRGIYLS